MIKKHVYMILIYLFISSCRFGGDTFQGYVDSTPVYLNSPVSGQLVDLKVATGDEVNAGQLLYKLHDMVAENEYGLLKAEYARSKALLLDSESGQRDTVMLALKSQIKQAQALYDLSVKRFDRSIKLKEKGAIDQETYDNDQQEVVRLDGALDEAKANYEDAKLGSRSELISANKEALKSSQFNLAKIKSKLQQMEVKAPVSGYVLDTYYSVGEWVSAMQPVVSVVNPNDYYVRFYLPIYLLPEAKVGMKIEIHTLGSDKKYYATITSISSEATYTPPMVYADDNTSKFVYLVKASLEKNITSEFNLGQPVTIIWNR
ncbi:MAG: HlyD family efflux transporter periplasmic adaptor subunit [Legionellales bacterium]|jgi:HlyD family secretion protein|nr:HlyD family efflux transporter periplasmic adaptor subunit [Legionellales bacterium]